MAHANSNNANGNVATGKKFSYEEMLAKALGTTPDKVKKSSELVKGVDELFEKAMAVAKGVDAPVVPYKAPVKKSGKTSQELLAEIDAEILEKENAEDVEEIEIVEVTPVVGKKKVIAQNTAQAQKLIATKAIETKPEMTDEEKKIARRKEISRIALEAKRAKKAQAEAQAKSTTPDEATLLTRRFNVSKDQAEKIIKETPKPESITRTRTNVPKPESKPDAILDLINKGKANEARAKLNTLLVEHKGMTLEKIEESAGKLSDAMVNELISKLEEISTPTSKKEEKKVTRTRTTPPKKSTMTRAETYSLALKDEPTSLEAWAKRADEIFVENDGKSNMNQALADVKWLSKFYTHYNGETFPTK